MSIRSNNNCITGKDFEKLDFSSRNQNERNQPKKLLDTENDVLPS